MEAEALEPISAVPNHGGRQRIVKILGVLLAIVTIGGVALIALDARWNTTGISDEQKIQACGFEYTATYDAHFGQLLTIGIAAGPNPSEEVTDRLRFEARAAAEMALRRIGLIPYVRIVGVSGFVCPAIPDRLVVAGIDPTDQNPP